MAKDQTSLEGYRLATKQDLKKAFREVLQEEGILGLAKKRASWDQTYWGDEKWLECRARAVRLILQNLIVAWGDLDQDPYFHRPKENGGAGWSQPIQFHRAIDQHFLPNKPEAQDSPQLRAFQTGKRMSRYLTLDKWLGGGANRPARQSRVSSPYGPRSPPRRVHERQRQNHGARGSG